MILLHSLRANEYVKMYAHVKNTNKNFHQRFKYLVSAPESKHCTWWVWLLPFFFLTLSEQVSQLPASDDTTGFLIWHLRCQQVVNESQSQGWQRHQHDHPLWETGRLWCRQPGTLPLTPWGSQDCLALDWSRVWWQQHPEMGAAPDYASFIIIQPSLSLSYQFTQGSAMMRKQLGPPWVASVSKLCISAPECLNASRSAFASIKLPVYHQARLSRSCWKHRSSQGTLIGSAGNAESEVDDVEMN